MKRAVAVLAAVAALAAAVQGCGISPTDVENRGRAPTIDLPPPTKTIYLLKDGELTREPADVESGTVDSLLGALFAASSKPLRDRDTALRGFTFLRIKDSLKPLLRDEVIYPRTSTLTVYIKGEGTLTKLGKAQIVCTAQLDAAIAEVKIVRESDTRTPKMEGQHICKDFIPRPTG
ncbi:hypothetical protein HII36_27565 [Nonomuraea sp. NN258]|uniref:hypothetical protein n=1 Tax=Nonomuraea antri TaxID=2730852 RepID=UPI0015686DE5|nr:hypothetical protein [Nonomuraea antri]NRQ35562.1 hypothetical protein [Nonomuraea antri]